VRVECGVDRARGLLDALPGFRTAHVGAEDAESDGCAAVERDPPEETRGGVRDDPVVVGVAGDDDAEDGDRVDVVASRQAVCDDRRVVHARDGDALDDDCTSFLGALDGAGGNLVRELGIEPRDDERHRRVDALVAVGC